MELKVENKKISIVISVYNEEQVLNEFFKAFDFIKIELLWEYEIIFVDDGSSDNSFLLLADYAKKDVNVKIISFSRNYGHEAAMIAGIDNATGDGIICMDADLQHPLSCINQIINKFEDGYQVINMVRTANKSAGIIKNVTSKAFYKVINMVADRVYFEENASDFFAVSKSAADVLRNNYREKVRFLRGYVQNIGFKKTAIKYEAAERAGGKSHYSVKRLLSFSINAIVCFSDLPLKLGIYAGLLSAILGTIVLIYSLVTLKGAPSGYTSLITLNCFMFAVLFIVVGIIGQYIAVLFTEIKDRPIYVIERKINFEQQEKNF